MSLKHVPTDSRLKVSLEFLGAIMRVIERGDLPAGMPLYPESTLEYFAEIQKAGQVIDNQAAEIAELREELKQLGQAKDRLAEESRLRDARINPPAQQTRLQQLSETAISAEAVTQGEPHETEQSSRTAAGLGEWHPHARRKRTKSVVSTIAVVQSSAPQSPQLLDDWDEF